MGTPAERQLNELLQFSAEELDISDELDQKLSASYQDLGDWFKRDNADRYSTDSDVYPQGSKRLGTLTAPVKPQDDCDLDVVYQRDLKRTSVSQQELKEQAGEQLERYLVDRRHRGLEVPRLEEGSRCWTLLYAGFHMDILPALPEDDHTGNGTPQAPDGIIITDKAVRAWQSSNPKAYSMWFRERMKRALSERRVALAKSAGVDVESIPEETVKTPLQRAVQVLKRYRDVSYSGPPDEKPISIVITTLAAHAYGNESDTLSALRVVSRRMPEFIRSRDDVPWVENPTNPDENFADKWEAFPAREKIFLSWLADVYENLKDALNQQGIDKVAVVLSKGLGEHTMDRALRRYGANMRAQRTTGALTASRGTAKLGTAGSIAVPPHTFFGRDE